MKRTVSLFLCVALLVVAAGCTTYHAEGAGAGGLIGGAAGALLDHRNPWRGGVIGGALGAVAGATLVDISMRASREAALSGKPVEYRTSDGHGMYHAEPLDYDEQTHCTRVREKVWEDGYLVKDRLREVCDEGRYRSGNGKGC